MIGCAATGGQGKQFLVSEKPHELTIEKQSTPVEEWTDPSNLMNAVAKQRELEARGALNPFEYFGAIDMPEIPPEDMPAHELI